MLTEKQKRLMITYSIINLIIILLCAGGCIYTIIASCGVYFSVSACVELLALVFSVLYFVRAYRIDAHKYYTLFMLFYAFTFLVEYIVAALGYEEIDVESKASLVLVVGIILYGNTLILATKKDLNKKVAVIICACNAFFYLLPIIGCFIPDMIVFGSKEIKATSMILYFTWFFLALNALTMTLAKHNAKPKN